MKKLLIILLVLFNVNCAEAQVKVQDLTEDTAPARTDIGYSIKTPSSQPRQRKVQWGNILDLSGWSLSGSTITSTKNVTTTGTVTANAFVGDGSGLTGIVGGSGSNPGGSGSELQYRSSSTSLGAVSNTYVDGGNIGIGGAPTELLDVKGNIKALTDVKVGIGAVSVCLADGTNCPSAGSESDPVVKALTGIIKSNGTTISAVTAPSGTVVGTTDSQTLTNKTISGSSNTISNITESMQSTSDVTTNNATTSKHGYIKKLSGTSTEYMDGSGNWSTPAGSGGSGGGFTDGGTNVYLTTSTDNVGIGTIHPASGVKLDVRGGPVQVWTGSGTNNQATSSGELYVQGDLEVDGNAYINNLSSSTTLGSQAICLIDGTNCPAAAGNGWTDGGSNVYTSTTTDTVGIGTTTPSASQEIVKQGSAVLFMASSAPTGDGDFLIIKSSGNVGIGTVLPGTLLDVQGQGRFNSVSFSGSAGQTNFANANGIAFDSNASTMTTPDVVMTSGGNVGIGTSTASTKLYVNGTITATAYAGDGSGLTGIGAGGWTDGGTNVYLATTTDNVGIGTTTPASGTALTVFGNSSSALTRINNSANGSTLMDFYQGSNQLGYIKSTSGTTNGGIELQGIELGTARAFRIRAKGQSDNASDEPLVQITPSNNISNVSSRNLFGIMNYTDDAPLFVIGPNGNVGIGTFSALTSKLNIGGSGNNIFNSTSGNVGIGTTVPTGKLSVNGHIHSAGTALSLSSCGTSPTITGNDTAGLIVPGTGTVFSCTGTFSSAYNVAPLCFVQEGTSYAPTFYVTTTTTGFIINSSGVNISGHNISYFCIGRD